MHAARAVVRSRRQDLQSKMHTVILITKANVNNNVSSIRKNNNLLTKSRMDQQTTEDRGKGLKRERERGEWDNVALEKTLLRELEQSRPPKEIKH